MPRSTLFPYIKEAARACGISRVALWQALVGRTSNASLVKRYFAFAAPKILASIPLPSLPAGTRLSLLAGAEAVAIGGVLIDFTRPDGQDLVLTAPLRVAPWPIIELPAATDAGAPVSLERRRKVPRRKATARGTTK
jgi:hypothetical protein